MSNGRVDVPWRDGIFTAGQQDARIPIGATGIFHYLNARGDTIRVLGRPTVQVPLFVTHTAALDGRFYVGGAGDGQGTGQSPLAQHFTLACLDTAGRFRWQRQYLNPIIRLSTQFPAFAGGYAYLRQVLPALRHGLLLLGDTQRDSVNFQLYAIEVDSSGQPRRTRWIEPFGRRARVEMVSATNAVRLRDGSGYVLTGYCRLDSLNRSRARGFVAKIDTALRVVWRTLLPAPTAAGPADATADIRPGQVRERADGGLTVMVTEQFTNGHPRVRQNEFDLVRLSPQGRVLGWDTYCSAYAQINPDAWQYLPADSSVVVAGWCQQRDAAGRLLAQPAWLARRAAPCRRYVPPTLPTATTRVAGAAAGSLYPQPARAGEVVYLEGMSCARPGVLRMTDALGREVLRCALPMAEGQAASVALPIGLRPGVYAMQVLAAGMPVAIRKLLVVE